MDEFYSRVAASSESVHAESGNVMLALLASLRAHSDPRQAWALTSHYHLCFLAKNTYLSPWLVKVAALDRRNFVIEYRMPEQAAPWPEAYVKGEASSPEDALRMILIAMDNSGGWSVEQHTKNA